MELPQYFAQTWESIPNRPAEPEKNPTCFDCSICLDFARDPVVTLCGHLHCWPCIYKWINSQSSSDKAPQCPVCKAQISEKTIVPLYGRGHSFSESEPESKAIPPRPPTCDTKALVSLLDPKQPFMAPPSTHPPPHHHHHVRSERNSLNDFTSYGEHSLPRFNLCGTAVMSLFHPTVGVFGEIINANASVFDDSHNMYTRHHSYYTVGSRSRRLRRRELRVEESLNRVTIFLLCFFLLCLVVF